MKEKNFNEDRIRAAITRIVSAKNKSTQGMQPVRCGADATHAFIKRSTAHELLLELSLHARVSDDIMSPPHRTTGLFLLIGCCQGQRSSGKGDWQEKAGGRAEGRTQEGKAGGLRQKKVDLLVSVISSFFTTLFI